MAVAWRAKGTQSRAFNASSGSKTDSSGAITIASGDTILIVELSYGQASATNALTVTAPTVGGVSLTHADATLPYSGNGGVDSDGWSDLWYILAPDVAIGTGSKTLTVSVSGYSAVNGFVQGVAHCYTGAVNASPTFGTHVHSSGSGVSSITVGVTSLASGDLAVGFCTNGTAPPSMTTGTSRDSQTGSTNFGDDNLNFGDNSGTGTVNLIWSTNSGDESSGIGIRILADTGGGGGGSPAPSPAAPYWVGPFEQLGQTFTPAQGPIGDYTALSIATTALVAVGAVPMVGRQKPFVTSADSGGRFLKDQYGAPIFVAGCSPQNQVSGWTLAQWTTFLSDQASRGFNSLQLHAVYNFQADAETSTNPFGSNSTLSPQNANYWSTVDSIINLCASAGFTVWLDVIDNISCGSSIASTADADCTSYGTFLGNRYKSFPNIVWIVGNDFDSSQWAARNSKYKKITDAIAAAGDTHLLTIWNNTQAGDANTFWNGVQTIDNGYQYSTPSYYQTDTAWSHVATGYPQPFVWFEGTYAGELNAVAGPPNATNLELRKLPWACITWGGKGHFFGTHFVWGGTFANYTTELTTWAAPYTHMGIVTSAFSTLTGWQLLVPDQSHVFQTGGRGTFEGGDLDTDTFSTAAFINGGTLGVTYFPSSRGSITYDTTKLSGTVTAYWLDPTNGSTSTESNPAAPTHPGTNAGGDPDWVLVHQGTAVVNQATTAFLPAGVVAAAPVGHDVAVSPLLPVAVSVAAPVGHDVPVSPLLPVAVNVAAPVGHDAAVSPLVAVGVASSVAATVIQLPTTALLAAAAVPSAPTGHDVSLSAFLPAAAASWATISHDVPVSPSLFLGVLVISSGPSVDQPTFAVLAVGASSWAPVGHDVPVTPIIPVGVAASAPVGHDVAVSPKLYVAAVPAAGSAVIELPTTALLAAGVVPRAPVGHDVAVSPLLPVGVYARAPVGHDATVNALLAAGAVPLGIVSHNTAVTAGLYVAVSLSAVLGVTPTVLAPMITEAIIDGRSFTIALLDGRSYTEPV